MSEPQFTAIVGRAKRCLYLLRLGRYSSVWFVAVTLKYTAKRLDLYYDFLHERPVLLGRVMYVQYEDFQFTI